MLTVFMAWRKLRNMADVFRRQMDGTQAGHSRNNGTYGSAHSASSARTSTPTGETIIDERTPEQANRKIFSKDEGEYVDYTEK